MLPFKLTASSAQDLQLRDDDKQKFDLLFKTAISNGKMPGAVFVLGHKNRILYQNVYGARALVPQCEAMRFDTIFDMASLTKPLITAVALMQFWEQGLFQLDDPVIDYLPDFNNNDKSEITIRHILTHFSGLPDDLDLKTPWSGKKQGVDRALHSVMLHPAGEKFVYSDVNYIIAQLLVEKFSAMTLDEYAQRNILMPLGLSNSCYLPSTTLQWNIAPTQYEDQADPAMGKHIMLKGVVNDSTTRRMGGVAGHAGLFAIADDITVYVQALLNCYAKRESNFPLNHATLRLMCSPQQPSKSSALRGLGWDIDTVYSRPRGDKFPIGSFGHTGYTGTSLWIDPASDTFVLILTSRLHPDGTGDVRRLRYDVASLAAACVGY